MEKRSRSWLAWGRLGVAALLVALIAQPLQAAQAAIPPNPILVVEGGSGNETCRNWDNACTLAHALSIAQPGNFIWVAQGKHVPGDLRTSTFKLKSGVTIYGGFKGTESYPDQRDWTKYVTILSGDIGLDGKTTNNAFHVVDSSGTDATAVLDGFTIQNGNADGSGTAGKGAGLYNVNGSPTLRRLIFVDNAAVSSGAGMFNSGGSASLTDVTFRDNIAASSTVGAKSYGGGMYNVTSSPTLTKVTFDSNRAGIDFSSDGSGGGLFNSFGGSPTLTNVTFSNNSAVSGGGMYVQGAGSHPKLSNVRFNNNYAQDNGGGVYVDAGAPSLNNVTLSGNKADLNGGGMFDINAANPKLTRVLFSANIAASNGGGMYNDGSAPTLRGARFAGNKAGLRGGGMYNTNSSAPVVKEVTFSTNSASSAGGMQNIHSSSPTLENVTFNANAATNNGGGIHNEDASNPTVTNVTFSGNTGAGGAGMYNAASSPTIQDSIFWADGTEEIRNSSSSPAISDSIVKGGCPATGTPVCSNVLTGDPKLGLLQDNGGFAPTMALGSGSAAVDKGNNSTCASTDQRAVKRPQGPKCDAGAYEVRMTAFRSVGGYDGQVRESAVGTNMGGPLNSTDATMRVGDDVSDRNYRGFLSFNTAPLPDAVTVVFARIKVKESVPPAGNPFVTQGGLLVDQASGFGTSWSLESVDYQAEAGVSPAGSFGSTPAGGWYAVTLNSASLAKINRFQPTQFRLRFRLADGNHMADFLTLFTGDDATFGNRPVLMVYYNP